MEWVIAISGYLVAATVAVVAVARRRTQARRRAAAPDSQAELFRLAVEEAGHAIYITDADGTIEYVNPAFSRITGYEPREVIGKTSRVLKSSLMNPSYYERLWTTLTAGKTWHEDIINRTRRGELYYASQTIAPIMDEHGRPRRFVAIQTDITARRRIEQQLTEREYQYRLLAEHATDMITRHAPDGRYVYVSPACRSLLGYEPDELVGRSAYELFCPENLPRIQDTHTSILDNGDSAVVAYRILHKDGHWVWCETTSKTVRNETTRAVEEIIAITRNIDDRMRIQSRLEAARQEAESANRTKSEFLANMSHEIKTPLNAILGYGEMLRKRIDEPELRGYADLICSAGGNLLKLLNNVLDLSKMDAGKMALNPVPAGPRQIAEEVVSMFALRAREKGVRLWLAVAESVPDHVIIDDTRFRQILVNLVGNAAKFTDRGSIEVRLDATVDDGDGESGAGARPARRVALRLEVEDSGVGIPTDRIDAIFEPFEQADSGIGRSHGGTGLGLAITRRLVDLLGGTLEATSTRGEGSCFTVTLPGLAVATDASPAEREGTHGEQRPARPADPPELRRDRASYDAPPAVATGSDRRRGETGGRDHDRLSELRRSIGKAQLEEWRRLYRVKLLDELAAMARSVGERAAELDLRETATLASDLAEAAARYDVSRVDELAPRLEAVLYGRADGDA